MNHGLKWLAALAVLAWLALAPAAYAQRRPYLGYAYPAGGQIATTVQLKIGGQDLDDVNAVHVTGSGITGRIVQYHRRLNNQEIQLLNEQLRELKRATPAAAAQKPGEKPAATSEQDADRLKLIARIETRVREWVQTPACVSISAIAYVELTIAPDAEPGPRELRLVTPRGISNALAFHVGQLPEFARQAMKTATIQVLGKEAGALRKRPAGEAEEHISIPCTLNGQIASGEVNRYRFSAAKGQQLVINTLARQLIPYVADAVPGWFQPVIALYDANGRELAYADDYRFKPDPVILYPVPQDGDYVLEIHDSLYRGREDFVYRITVGDLPFVKTLFPLGAQVGHVTTPNMEGCNVDDADLTAPRDGAAGQQWLAAHRLGLVSPQVPFAIDSLPDTREQEPNNTAATAQQVDLPIIVNGRIDATDDWDVFQFTGRANDRLVVEVQARRLESPLDAVVKLTDAKGEVIAFNDDREDVTSGLNTHHADSYLVAKLPAAGPYFVHLGDTARKGGNEYAYRLRISAPQPDFELRVVPSSVSMPINTTAAVTVYAQRKDGFTGPIKLTLDKPPGGVTALPITIPAGQTEVRLTLRAPRTPVADPVKLSVLGSAKIGNKDVTHEAVPADDRMQAFLWRHLVPAQQFMAVVYDRNVQAKPRHVPPPRPTPAVQPAVAAQVAAVAQAATTNSAVASVAASVATTTAAKPAPKFTKQQIVGRLRQLKLLYEEGLLSDSFYDVKVTECEAAQ